MKIRFVCGCNLENYNLEDWLSHFKYGTRGWWHAVKLFLRTKIVIERS